MSGPGLEINLEWYQFPTDGSKCTECEELIVTDMWWLHIFVDEEDVETGFKLCSSCYQLKGDDDSDNEDERT